MKRAKQLSPGRTDLAKAVDEARAYATDLERRFGAGTGERFRAALAKAVRESTEAWARGESSRTSFPGKSPG